MSEGIGKAAREGKKGIKECARDARSGKVRPGGARGGVWRAVSEINGPLCAGQGVHRRKREREREIPLSSVSPRRMTNNKHRGRALASLSLMEFLPIKNLLPSFRCPAAPSTLSLLPCMCVRTYVCVCLRDSPKCVCL